MPPPKNTLISLVCLVVLMDDQLLYVVHNPLVQRTQVLTYLMLPNLVSRVCSIDRPYRCAEQCDKVLYMGVRVPVSLDRSCLTNT